MTSKPLAQIGAASLLSGIMVITLLAGCGKTTTITNTTTVTNGTGGSGTPVTVTATTTKTVSTGGGSVMANLVIYGDLASSTAACVVVTAAHRGELMVFRARIIDPKTGNDMTDQDIKASSVLATLKDTNVNPIVFAYGTHGTAPYSDKYWVGTWEVPLTEPTGTMPYTITATANDGRTGSWSPFNLAASLLTVAAYDPNFVAAKSVNIAATGFSVATLACSQGATVTFNNKDTIPHTVIGPDWNSGLIAAAGNYKYKFTTAGTYVVHLDNATSAFTCTITVNPAPTS